MVETSDSGDGCVNAGEVGWGFARAKPSQSTSFGLRVAWQLAKAGTLLACEPLERETGRGAYSDGRRRRRQRRQRGRRRRAYIVASRSGRAGWR